MRTNRTNKCVCAPYQSLSINVQKLASVYGVDPAQFTPQVWESRLQMATAGPSLKRIWNRWVKCPGYEGQPFQYATSYHCLTDLFVYSAECNQQPVPPLCPEVCQQYGQAVSAMVQDPNVCPPVEDPMIGQRRTALAQAFETCAALLQQPNFQGQCLPGVKIDQQSCGTFRLIRVFWNYSFGPSLLPRQS